MSSGIKAGLIGAAAAVVLALLGLVACLNCITPILTLLLYIAVGALAAYWMTPPRTAGVGAGAGAIAGLITGVVEGIVNMIIAGVRFASIGGQQAIISQIPPEVMEQLIEQLGDAGLELARAMTSIGGVLGMSALCCVVGIAVAAGLGAAGGAVMAAVKSD